MSGILLDAMTEDRPRIRLQMVELRRVTTHKTSVEELRQVVPQLTKDQDKVFGLPSPPVAGATFMSVSLSDSEDSDTWEVEWRRLPQGDVPDSVRENTFGEVGELEEALKRIWKAHLTEDSKNTLQFHYIIAGYKTPLLRRKNKEFGRLVAVPVGAVWKIKGTQFLEAVAPVASSERDTLVLAAYVTMAGGGWLDVLTTERTVWEELSFFLKEREAS